MDTYQDKWIQCTDTDVRIRGYYFPWGTKRILYGDVRGLTRVSIRATRGQARIWGTANPKYWASLDPGRPRKHTAFLIDLGRSVEPFVTPDDPDRFEAVLREHVQLPPQTKEVTGPFI